jgi:hypothetical protein
MTGSIKTCSPVPDVGGEIWWRIAESSDTQAELKGLLATSSPNPSSVILVLFIFLETFFFRTCKILNVKKRHWQATRRTCDGDM